MQSINQSINQPIIPSPLSHVFLIPYSCNQSINQSFLHHLVMFFLIHWIICALVVSYYWFQVISWKSQQSFGSVVDAPHNLKLSSFLHLTEIPIHHRFPIIIALSRNFRLGTAGHRWYLKHTWTMHVSCGWIATTPFRKWNFGGLGASAPRHRSTGFPWHEQLVFAGVGKN